MTAPICVLHGPNLDMLGEREPRLYGHDTLADTETRCAARAAAHGTTIVLRQTNDEGQLVEWIHEARRRACGIVVNPAGLGFFPIPLPDAPTMFDAPRIEVHLSDIHAQEEIHHRSLVSRTANAMIAGLGAWGYEVGIDALHRCISG